MPRRPAVWIINHYASTPAQGAGTRHYDLGRQLVRRGYDVTIFAASFSHFSGTDEQLHGLRLWRTTQLDGITFVWIRSVPYRGNGLRRVLNMISFAAVVLVAQVTRSSPGAVIGSTVHPLAAWAGAIIAGIRRRPFLYEVRDLWPQTLIDMGAMKSRSFPARLLRRLEAHLVRRAHVVITVLPGMRDYLGTRRLPTHHVRYLPNGADLERQEGTPLPEDISNQIDQWRAGGRFVVAYVGSQGRANALETVIDAVQTPNGRSALLMVGSGPARSSLEARVGSSNVRFFDPVAKSSIGELMSRIDAGVFHLADNDVFRYGISSNKLFDYMANARPVIFACRTTYNPVDLAQAGISVTPEDPRAMAEAIDLLASTPADQRRAMGVRGRDFIAQHHSVRRLAAELAGILDEAIGSVS